MSDAMPPFTCHELSLDYRSSGTTNVEENLLGAGLSSEHGQDARAASHIQHNLARE